jgi:lysyl-tRNA synthetase class I
MSKYNDIYDIKNLVIKSDNLDKLASEIAQQKRKDNGKITIAAGITTAYEIGDNQLREFFVAKEIEDILKKRDIKVRFLLINDSRDEFSERHMKLLKKTVPKTDHLKRYLGRPIYLVPCSYGCCDSLATHFSKLLLDKLKAFDISPKMVFSHEYYNDSKNKQIRETLMDFLLKSKEIENYIKKRFGIPKRGNLVKVICKHCNRLDSTAIKSIDNEGNIEYNCIVCGKKLKASPSDVKFGWRLDCVLRWMINKVDFEPFYENYLQYPNGSFYVSSDIARTFFEFDPPLTVKMAYIRHRNVIPISHVPKNIIKKQYLENFQTSKQFNIYKIIADAQKIKYPSGFSFYQASKIIGCLEISLGDSKTIKRINNTILKFNANDKIKHLVSEISLLQNFYTIIPSNLKAPKLRSINSIHIHNGIYADWIYRILTNKKIKERDRPTAFKVFYKSLFGTSYGPPTDLLVTLLPPSYKNKLIDRIHDRNANKHAYN